MGAGVAGERVDSKAWLQRSQAVRFVAQDEGHVRDLMPDAGAKKRIAVVSARGKTPLGSETEPCTGRSHREGQRGFEITAPTGETSLDVELLGRRVIGQPEAVPGRRLSDENYVSAFERRPIARTKRRFAPESCVRAVESCRGLDACERFPKAAILALDERADSGGTRNLGLANTREKREGNAESDRSCTRHEVPEDGIRVELYLQVRLRGHVPV